MTNLFIVIVVLIFAALIYGFYLMQKASSEILYTSVYSVVCRDTFWWYLTGDLWNWLGSDHPITRVDHNGGERLCSTAANVDHAIGFVSIVGAFTKMKESEKSKKSALLCWLLCWARQQSLH